MSAWSEYRVGAISEDEFKSAMRRECEDPYDRFTCFDCSSYRDCQEQVARLGYPQCEDGETKFEDEYEVYEALQENEFMQTVYGCTDSEAILRDNSLVDIQADYREWEKANESKKIQ